VSWLVVKLTHGVSADCYTIVIMALDAHIALSVKSLDGVSANCYQIVVLALSSVSLLSLSRGHAELLKNVSHITQLIKSNGFITITATSACRLDELFLSYYNTPSLRGVGAVGVEGKPTQTMLPDHHAPRKILGKRKPPSKSWRAVLLRDSG